MTHPMADVQTVFMTCTHCEREKAEAAFPTNYLTGKRIARCMGCGGVDRCETCGGPSGGPRHRRCSGCRGRGKP